MTSSSARRFGRQFLALVSTLVVAGAPALHGLMATGESCSPAMVAAVVQGTMEHDMAGMAHPASGQAPEQSSHHSQHPRHECCAAVPFLPSIAGDVHQVAVATPLATLPTPNASVARPLIGRGFQPPATAPPAFPSI